MEWERDRDRKRQRRKREEREKEREGGGVGKKLKPSPFRKQYHQSTDCPWAAQDIPLPPGEASLEHHLWGALSFKLHCSLLSFSDASNKSVKTLSVHYLVPIMLPFSWVPYFGCMNGLTCRACGCPVWHQEGMHVPPVSIVVLRSPAAIGPLTVWGSHRHSSPAVLAPRVTLNCAETTEHHCSPEDRQQS